MSDATIHDDAWKLPPLPPTGKGVYRLRDGTEEEVDEFDDPGWPWIGRVSRFAWTDLGYYSDNEKARHPRDIVALVSLAPTGPGWYESDSGSERLVHKSAGYWAVTTVSPVLRWDEWGRAYWMGERDRGHDIRRRIGDLPAEPKPVVESRDEIRAVREANSREGIVMHGDRDRAIREMAAWAKQLVVEPSSYTSEEGAAAMAALMDEPFLAACERLGRSAMRAVDRGCGVALTRNEARVASTAMLRLAREQAGNGGAS
jgi:hypothetical protein